MTWFVFARVLFVAAVAYSASLVRPVHELALVNGSVGYLTEPLVHFNYASLGEFVRKQERYCGLEADRWLTTSACPRCRVGATGSRCHCLGVNADHTPCPGGDQNDSHRDGLFD